MADDVIDTPGDNRSTERVKGDNRLFVSYSRRDTVLVRALCDALEARGVGVWIDWEDIPPSAEWWAEITRAIDSADAFAFVISPDSLASQVCRDELAHAVAAGKRLLPVVHRDHEAGQQVPDALARLNWIFMRDPAALDAPAEQFVRAFTTDLELLRTHARLLVRAREWETGGRDASYLLRGSDLDAALQWLGAVSASASGPLPTELHRDYLIESQRAQREQGERWRRLYEEALARDLATRSQLLVDQRGTALPLAALLAVEAARRSPSLQTDHALRKVLRLLPLRHAVVTDASCEHHVVAPAVERMATVTGSRLDVWDLAQREIIRSIEAGGELLTAGLSLMPFALSDDGTLVAAVVDERTVRVWQVEDGSVRLEHLCDALVRGVAFSREATALAVTLDRPASLLFDLSGGEPVLLEHASVMQNIAWRPRGQEVVFWGQDAAEVWTRGDVTQRSSTIPLGYAGGPTTGFQYSPSGEYLALVQRSTFAVRVFHVPTRTLIFSEDRHVDVAFHPGDKAFAIVSPEWSVAVYDLPRATQRFKMMHDNSVWRVGFSGDGTRLSTSSRDGTTRIWELDRKGAEVARFVEGTGGPRSVLFSRDGWRVHRIFETRIETSDARGFEEWRILPLESPVFDVDAWPNQALIALGARNGTWVVGDYASAGQMPITDAEPGRNAMGEQISTARLLSPTLALLKRSSGPYQVRDLAARRYLDTVPADPDAMVAGSRTGLLVRYVKGELTVIDAQSGDAETRSIKGEVRAIAVSGDGTVAALLDASEARFVSTRKRGRAPRTRIPIDRELSLELDTSGSRVALWRADDDGSVVRVVSTADGTLLARWQLPSRLHDLRFDRSGDHVVLALKDGTVQVWRADAGVPLASLQHPAEATSAAFTTDPGLVVSGSWDGSARIWPWLPEQLIRAVCMRLDRDLTQEEWAQYLPGQPYRSTRNPEEPGGPMAVPGS